MVRLTTAGALVAGAIVLSAGTLLLASPPNVSRGLPHLSGATGHVVSTAGRPIAGAQVTSTSGGQISDAEGSFALGPTPTVYAVQAPGFASRTVVAQAQERVRVTLAPATSITLRFGGDVMAGRRYFNTNPGQTSPLLSRIPTAAENQGLLARLRPLLEDADLTVVNLETPLVVDPGGPMMVGVRPAYLHQTKTFAFASGTGLAEGLARSGVDIVDLANNHSYDALTPGLVSTLAALDQAGVRHVGAGMTLEDARQPLVTTVRGRQVAFVACTEVMGLDLDPTLVAGPGKAGAAGCDGDWVLPTVQRLVAQGALVTLMIHGGVEQERLAQGRSLALADAARAAGARLVMNSHPHVIGAVASDGKSAYAATMGNVLFDQNRWETLVSYLTRVDVPPTGDLTLSADPFIVDGYLPTPVTGAVADRIGRIAMGDTSSGVRLVENRASTLPASAVPRKATVELPPGVSTLAEGWVPTPTSAPSADTGEGTMWGTDLLFGSGDFEADVPTTSGHNQLWDIGATSVFDPTAACTGSLGVRALRSPNSEAEAVVTTSHRVSVVPGRKVTLVAQVRSQSPGATMELRWYPDFEGPSAGKTTVDLAKTASVETEDGCRQVTLEATVPAGIVAAQPFFRLYLPTGAGETRHLAIDDVRLVDWETSPLWAWRDVVRGSGRISLDTFGDTPDPLSR